MVIGYKEHICKVFNFPKIVYKISAFRDFPLSHERIKRGFAGDWKRDQNLKLTCEYG